MGIKIFSVVSLLFVVGSLSGQSQFDFQRAKWGQSRGDVLAEISTSPDKSGKLFVTFLNGFISGFDCDINYYFAEDKLAMGEYLFRKKHSNSNDYVSDYKYLKSLLEKKYSNTFVETIDWKNTTFKDDPTSIGLAISMGHLEMKAVLETGSTRIVLLLSGENLDVQVSLQYQSLSLRDKLKSEFEREDSENL